MGAIGVEFGSQKSAALGIKCKGWSVVAEVLCPRLQVEAGEGQLEDAGANESNGV